MDKIDQFAFYQLGQQISPLTIERGESAPSFDEFMLLWRTQLNFETLLKGDPVVLRVSRQPAVDASKAISDAIDKYYREPDGSLQPAGNNAGAVPKWQWATIRKCVESFETVFKEELREAATYQVPNRGIYDTPKLVEEADCTFPKETLSQMPAKARSEWQAAGRCLAFGLLSSSGFHVARAIEAMMEVYVPVFKSKKKLSKNPTWGNYIDYLENIEDGESFPDERTLAEIRQMKDDWRNPLMHPRVILEESQARILFSTGESLIISMATDMKANKVMISPPGSANALLFGNKIKGATTTELTN